MKKLISLVLALTLVLASFAVAFAADPTGKIVIKNASKGIHYEIFKLFDATTDGNGAIAYTGTIPSSLTAYFKYVANTDDKYVEETDATREGNTEKLTDAAVTALKAWAATANKVGQADGNGDAVEFTELGYGYYVITSTQGDKKITVVTLADSEAEIVDKNTTTVTVGKKVDDKDVYVGEKVNYTLTVDTSNFLGEGTAAKQVVQYVIKDTLPPYLSSVKVNSVKIVEGENTTEITPTPAFSNKTIEIEWATDNNDGTYTSKYNNGAKILVEYEAVVNDQVYVGDANPNRNVLDVLPYVDDNGPKPWEKHFYDDEEIFTYGAAIHKVDEEGNSLKGAKFAIKGLTVASTGTAGEYNVANFDASSTTWSDDLEVDDNGYLYIFGLASDVKLTAKETKAPDGYNLVTTELELEPIKMSQTVTYTSRDIYYDENGKVIYDSGYQGGSSTTITANKETLNEEANVLTVENQKGVELPSTGGIGTTIFYVLGGLLVVGAAIILVSRRKAHD